MASGYSVTFERNVAVPMRDGTVLYADLFRPATQGTFPVLLLRTPYDKSGTFGSFAPFALRAGREGYAVLMQDSRGRFESEGTFLPFVYERQDGYDTCAWIQEQSWANGRIGMFGGSYVGATQWQAALGHAPGLEAIIPNVTAADYHEGWTYQGGASLLNFNLTWALGPLGAAEAARRVVSDPSATASMQELLDRLDAMEAEFDRLPLFGDPLLKDLVPYYDEWLAHPDHDDYWNALKVDGHYDQLDIASLNVGGWYDIFQGGTLRNYVGMKHEGKTAKARNASHLLIGPWEHLTSITAAPVGDWNPGVRSLHASIDFESIQIRWYDRWLRDIDNGVDSEPPVTIFVMGENTWRQEADWPIPDTRFEPYYLASDGKANTWHGDGSLSRDTAGGHGSRPDHFLYDPLNPVPTVGGGLCCNAYWAHAGSFDQRAVEQRPDVLCYTSVEVHESVEVTGPVQVVLYATSSAIDTDFTAKLVDVAPCGCARNLTDGLLRARYRTSKHEQTLLTPGEVTRYEIDLWATSNLFLPGHRIRVEISSSNFPRFDRNPNHGGVIATATREDCVVALQTIHHDSDHPSHIVLPVVKGELP